MNMNDTETEDKIDSHSYIPFRITASTTYQKDTVTATATATATTQITKRKKLKQSHDRQKQIEFVLT